MSESGDCHVMNSETDDGTIVYVRGEIDLTTHDTLMRMLDEAAARGQNVIVDLSRTTFMDSSGLQALMELWHSQTAAGLDLVVRNPSDPIIRTLHYAGLDRVFKIDRQSQPGS
jgi:stage II sporulation protein AA (anti-sigma F factor antagonist)